MHVVGIKLSTRPRVALSFMIRFREQRTGEHYAVVCTGRAMARVGGNKGDQGKKGTETNKTKETKKRKERRARRQRNDHRLIVPN